MNRLAKPVLISTNVILAMLFGVFAAFQFNDTNPEIYHRPSVIDAWSWVIFYALIAGLFILSIFRRVPMAVLVLAVAFCVYEMVTTAPGLYENLTNKEDFIMTGAAMAPTRSHVELSREFFGAVIALLGIGIIWWQRKAKRVS